MQTNGKCGKENVRQFFNCTQLLKWSEVKTALQLLSKNGIDMANYIETKMLYTKGKQISFSCLDLPKYKGLPKNKDLPKNIRILEILKASLFEKLWIFSSMT